MVLHNIYLRKYIGKSSSYLSSRPSHIKSFAHRILEEVGKSFCFLQSKSFKPNQFFGDNNAYCTSESKRVVFVCQVFQIKFERKYSYFSIYRWRHVARGHYHLLPTVQREVSIIIYCQLQYTARDEHYHLLPIVQRKMSTIIICATKCTVMGKD